jgi:mRNA interferase HicA
MKPTDLIRKLDESGCAFVRRGANHDWYRNPRTAGVQPVAERRDALKKPAN